MRNPIMSKTPVPSIILLSLCLLPACGVGPERAVTKAPDFQVAVLTDESVDASPQNKESQEREAKQRKERRKQDRERRTQEAKKDQDRRDDPDWPRNRDRDDRDSNHRRAWALLSWAGGDYDFKDARGVDDNGAEVFRFRTGATNSRGTGAGVDLKIYDAKHNAYRNTAGSTGLNQPDVFMFFTKRIGKGQFQGPFRIGPYYSLISAEQNSTGNYTSYNNIGVRLELEPTLTIFDRDNFTLKAYVTLSAGAHYTYIDDEITRNNYTSQGTTLGIEPGLRLVVGNTIFGASYHLNETSVGQSSRERGQNGVVRQLPRTETEFKGFMFTVGFRF